MFSRAKGVLVFDELTNGQTMHYSRHRLTMSVFTWLQTRMHQSIINELALLADWSVCQFSSVQFSCVALNAP